MLTSENEKKQKEIDNITKDRDRLSSELEIKEKERKQIEEEKQKETIAREKAEQISSLYKRKDELNKTIERLQAELSPYEKALKKSFCNWQPPLFYLLGFVFIIGVILSWIVFFVSKECLTDSFNENIGTLSMVLVPIGAICIGVGHHYNNVDFVNKRKEQAEKNWVGKEENANYKLLVSDLSHAQDELSSIEKELKANF